MIEARQAGSRGRGRARERRARGASRLRRATAPVPDAGGRRDQEACRGRSFHRGAEARARSGRARTYPATAADVRPRAARSGTSASLDRRERDIDFGELLGAKGLAGPWDRHRARLRLLLRPGREPRLRSAPPSASRSAAWPRSSSSQRASGCTAGTAPCTRPTPRSARAWPAATPRSSLRRRCTRLVSDAAALGIAASIAAVGLATLPVLGVELVAGIGLIGATLVPLMVLFEEELSPLGTAFVAIEFAATATVAVHRRWDRLLAADYVASLPKIALPSATASRPTGTASASGCSWRCLPRGCLRVERVRERAASLVGDAGERRRRPRRSDGRRALTADRPRLGGARRLDLVRRAGGTAPSPTG